MLWKKESEPSMEVDTCDAGTVAASVGVRGQPGPHRLEDSLGYIIKLSQNKPTKQTRQNNDNSKKKQGKANCEVLE